MFAIFMFKWIKKCMSDASESVTKSLTMRMFEKLQAGCFFFTLNRNTSFSERHTSLVSIHAAQM